MKPRTFKRDKRSPVPSSDKISYIMSTIKQKNTKPEMAIRRALFALGIKGYRLHLSKIPGKPDLAFVSKKLAIFIHGCFWHRCPYCNLPTPKSNTTYWLEKFEKNVSRDGKKIQALKELNWDIVVIWECQISVDLFAQIERIRELLITKS